jgi:hypothetical protein
MEAIGGELQLVVLADGIVIVAQHPMRKLCFHHVADKVAAAPYLCDTTTGFSVGDFRTSRSHATCEIENKPVSVDAAGRMFRLVTHH